MEIYHLVTRYRRNVSRGDMAVRLLDYMPTWASSDVEIKVPFSVLVFPRGLLCCLGEYAASSLERDPHPGQGVSVFLHRLEVSNGSGLVAWQARRDLRVRVMHGMQSRTEYANNPVSLPDYYYNRA